MKVAVRGYHAGKAWLCICFGVEPPFSKSWIRHCSCTSSYNGTYVMNMHKTNATDDVIGSVKINIVILMWSYHNYS